MRRIIAFILAMMIFGMALPASANGIEIYYDGEYHTYTGRLFDLFVNGDKLTVPLEPITFNNRALVPIREVFEALGAKVDYVNETKEVIITGNDIAVSLQIGNNNAKVNGKTVAIPDGVVPKLITKKGSETKTMVPVRFVSEEIGLDVDFDDAKGAILITGKVGEQPSKLTLRPPVIAQTDSSTVITINTNVPVVKEAKALMTGSGVLYFDVADATYTGAARTEVNNAMVTAVRYGLHDKYTRVAVDLKEYASYNVVTEQKKITITVTAKGAVPEPPATEVNPAPSAPPADTKPPATEDNTQNQSKKLVVLDPGHGGPDPGAISKLWGVDLYEKTIALSVTHLVKAELQAAGIDVIMTREDDNTQIGLPERSDVANRNNAAMFVSIHVNSAGNAQKANGIEVYYTSKNNGNSYGITSQALATSVLNSLIAETGALSRGVKNESHFVTRLSVMPAILVELGFISNEKEKQLLADYTYQQKLAKGISKGIISQIGNIVMPAPQSVEEQIAEN